VSSARSGPSPAGSPRRRREPPKVRRSAARIAAPLAFLAGLTAAVLLVRAGLSGSDATPVATLPATTSVSTAATTSVTSPTRTTTEATGGARFYTIESGDTLESIAADHGTSVEVLLELNPEVDPVALTVGQRIRVS
jgi:LysM repeat protein